MFSQWSVLVLLALAILVDLSNSDEVVTQRLESADVRPSPSHPNFTAE